MTDFRSPSQKRRDSANQQSEQLDYKREFEQARAENAALQAQLDSVLSSHRDLQSQFNQLSYSFDQFRGQINRQVDEMKRTAGSMEVMISNSFNDNKRLMETMRDSVTARLEAAKSDG